MGYEDFQIDSSKVWVDRYGISEFKMCYRGLPCKTKCDGCKRVWNDTATKTVSYAIDTSGKGRNLCQSCVSEL